MIWKKQGKDGQSAPLPRLVFLALLFLGGVLLGQVLSGRVPDTTGDELGRYLTEYLRLDGDTERTAATVLSAAVIYFRYPGSVAAALLHSGLWFFSVFFCLLFYCRLWGRRCFAGLGGLWPAVRSNTALLPSVGGSRLGNQCGTGRPILWTGKAGCAGGLWAELLGPLWLCNSCAFSGDVCGSVSLALAAPVDSGAYSGRFLKKKKEREVFLQAWTM